MHTTALLSTLLLATALALPAPQSAQSNHIEDSNPMNPGLQSHEQRDVPIDTPIPTDTTITPITDLIKSFDLAPPTKIDLPKRDINLPVLSSTLETLDLTSIIQFADGTTAPLSTIIAHLGLIPADTLDVSNLAYKAAPHVNKVPTALNDIADDVPVVSDIHLRDLPIDLPVSPPKDGLQDILSQLKGSSAQLKTLIVNSGANTDGTMKDVSAALNIAEARVAALQLMGLAPEDLGSLTQSAAGLQSTLTDMIKDFERLEDMGEIEKVFTYKHQTKDLLAEVQDLGL